MKKKRFQKIFFSMKNFSELWNLHDLVDFLELSMLINASLKYIIRSGGQGTRRPLKEKHFVRYNLYDFFLKTAKDDLQLQL